MNDNDHNPEPETGSLPAVPGLLDIPAVAKRLSVGRNFVYARIAEGDLKAVDIGTPARPRLRVSEEALAEFIKRRQDTGTDHDSSHP